MKYSEDQLVVLAKTNVEELIKTLSDPGTDSVTLTFGAEIIGSEIKDEQVVLPVLKKLLRHINALVREGAVIGVLSFYTDKSPPQEILDRLRYIISNDPSNTLKSFAKDSLEELQQL